MAARLDVRLAEHLAWHHGVISRAEALALGYTPRQLERRLATGQFVALHRGVYVLGGPLPGPATKLRAALLAAGAGAGIASGTAARSGAGPATSHWSAAWLWDLLTEAPRRPSITVARARHPELTGVTVHRAVDLPSRRITTRRGFPVTDPVRTVIDLAALASDQELDDLIDRAIASRLLRPQALRAELRRVARPGRRGGPRLRAALDRRGLVEPPAASVLESRLLRLLHSWGIVPLGVEILACGGRYRLDCKLTRRTALEVDGYTYHSSPAAKAADSARRNALRAAGITVVEADWLLVVRRSRELHRMIAGALALEGIRLPPLPQVRRSA